MLTLIFCFVLAVVVVGRPVPPTTENGQKLHKRQSGLIYPYYPSGPYYPSPWPGSYPQGPSNYYPPYQYNDWISTPQTSPSYNTPPSGFNPCSDPRSLQEHVNCNGGNFQKTTVTNGGFGSVQETGSFSTWKYGDPKDPFIQPFDTIGKNGVGDKSGGGSSSSCTNGLDSLGQPCTSSTGSGSGSTCTNGLDSLGLPCTGGSSGGSGGGSGFFPAGDGSGSPGGGTGSGGTPGTPPNGTSSDGTPSDGSTPGGGGSGGGGSGNPADCVNGKDLLGNPCKGGNSPPVHAP